MLPADYRYRVLNVLAWAGLNRPANLESSRPAWLGVGVTSPHRLPFDFLSMWLVGTALAASSNQPLQVLVADHEAHASGIAASSEIEVRVQNRIEDISRLARITRTRVEFVRSSSMLSDQERAAILAEVSAKCGSSDPMLTKYTLPAITEAVHYHRLGFIKVGWSTTDSLKPGHGRFDEFNGSDRFAACIDSGMTAFYTRPGETLDSQRKLAVPFSEPVNPMQRLMLTGDTAGNFCRQLSAPGISANRLAALDAQVSRITLAWEAMVGPLPGESPREQADAIVERLLNTAGDIAA